MRKLTDEEREEIIRTIETTRPLRDMSDEELALRMSACDRLMEELGLKPPRQVTNRGGRKQGKGRKTV